jgi:citrate/tricarballylate utilization protein
VASTDLTQKALAQEGERILRICNPCRYCEGYCAVFPAMELRQTFPEADLNYLANLCHNCSECYYACQYAPPHEFAVNVPKLLAEIRAQSYRQYAWPRAFARGPVVWLIIAVCLVLSMLLSSGTAVQRDADFYRIVPHQVMVLAFAGASVFVLIAFVVGFVRFWQGSGERLLEFLNPGALIRALGDVLTLHYLDGPQSQARRWFHQFTMYGFGLCFASTATAAFYHYALGWKAPYGYFSVPVVLGTAGGVAIVAGTLGLLWIKRSSNPEIKADGQDASFLILLFLTAASGILLLALRETAAMGALLIAHLGIVLALFLTLPYSRFVHAIYRSAALVKYALERSRGVHR